MLAMNLGYTDKQNLTTIAKRKDCQKTGLLSLWSDSPIRCPWGRYRVAE